ncbi:hypothetical protein M501DRAFT_1000893 [Patellaria atrata CBS 101060]|uniref:SUN domain-containing protein n=1 Tax=Patellaria atrata CBS 101060 TaxID=1346257 RepID=A0A9P4SGZ8_9PEZI|nr:hypothetical protein M501DRAFT_1000893 [Patellaria atrata CBS 101060]
MPQLGRNVLSRIFLFAAVIVLVQATNETTARSLVTTTPIGGTPTRTCQFRTVNYITHTLPQQCLRENWTASHARSTAGENYTVPTTELDARVTGVDASSGVEVSESVIDSVSSTSVAGAVDQIATASTKSAQSDLTNVTGNPSQSASHSSSTTSSTATATSEDFESETDSPLDNANFLSFEEWKKQNLAKSGQSPDTLGQGRGGSDNEQPRRRPVNINNALDGLGEDLEIDLDFAGFGGSDKSDAAAPARSAQTSSLSRASTVGSDSETQERVASSTRPRKDAGKTCKERFNYASFDCAATVLKTNQESKGSSSVLVENKDSYMLNVCSAANKFVIVELCEDILVDTVVLANYEFFSSMFRTFKVSVSDRYPVKMDRWKELGTFQARNSRDIQPFLIENPLIWARYLRVEFLSHYGNEYYCPLSLLRVHGTTMMEEFRAQEELARGEEDEEESIVEEMESEAVHSADTPVIEEQMEDDNTQHGVPESKETDSSQIDESGVEPSPSTPADGAGVPRSPTETGNQESARNNSNEENMAVLVIPIELANLTVPASVLSAAGAKSGKPSSPSSSNDIPSTSRSEESKKTKSTNKSTSTSSTAQRVNEKPSTQAGDSSTAKVASSITRKTSISTTHIVNTSDSSGGSLSTAQDAPRQASSPSHPPPPSPTTQESFFKSIHKRLQLLESNSTLSLQYIEEQSRILRDAFQKVEKRQLGKTETFLDHLNNSVMAELKIFRQQYDQLWQSTVIELENHRELHQQEILAVSTRLTLMAEELVWQKRMAVVQSTLLLLCLGLVLFVRSGNSSLELPVLQQMMQRSHSVFKIPYSPSPGSPARSSSPVSPSQQWAETQSGPATPRGSRDRPPSWEGGDMSDSSGLQSYERSKQGLKQRPRVRSPLASGESLGYDSTNDDSVLREQELAVDDEVDGDSGSSGFDIEEDRDMLLYVSE